MKVCGTRLTRDGLLLLHQELQVCNDTPTQTSLVPEVYWAIKNGGGLRHILGPNYGLGLMNFIVSAKL